MSLPAIVAVTVQVPALVERNAPVVTAHPAAVLSETDHVTEPAVEPPPVARVRSVPYVPEVLETVSAVWLAFPTVTVIVTVPPET